MKSALFFGATGASSGLLVSILSLYGGGELGQFGNYMAGLFFGAGIGLCLYREALIGASKGVGFLLASMGSYRLASLAAVSLYDPATMSRGLLAGSIGGLLGAVGLAGYIAMTIPGFRSARLLAPILLVGTLLGLLLVPGLNFSDALLFIPWQAGVGGMIGWGTSRFTKG